MKADVDVIIVTYASAGTIDACVRSARESAAVRRIIVVDNASQDASAELAALAGADCVVRLESNVGFSAGVNRGLREADAEFVLLLNPDAFMMGDALAVLRAALIADSLAVAAGPVLLGEDGSLCLGARRFSTVWNRVAPHVPLLRKYVLGAEYPDAALLAESSVPVVVDYLWGAALLVRREYLACHGGLDERYFIYFEDEDFGRTAARDGRRSLVVPRAQVTHIGAVSSHGRDDLVLARQLLSNGLLFEKWAGLGTSVLFGVGIRLALVLQLLAAAIRSGRSDMRRSLGVLRLLGEERSWRQ